MDMPTLTTKQLVTELRTLHQQGLYFQELSLAQDHWGPYNRWRTQDQLLIGGNIFANLGLQRIATAMRLWGWRKNRGNPEAIYYLTLATFARKGPLAALKLFSHHGDLLRAKPAIRARWLALKAAVYGQYRDWESAHQLLDKAMQLAPAHPQVTMELAYLLEQEDRYQEAADVVAPLAAKRFRPALQFAAHLKTLADDRDGAMALLKPAMESMESLSPCLQLFRLYQEKGDPENAARCVARARQWLPQDRESLSQELAFADYELAYQRRDFPEAMSILENIQAPFYQTVKKNLQQADLTRAPVKLAVPFVRQHHMTCAPATLTAIARYWNRPVDHLGIVEDICYDGTSNHAERQWALDQGWAIREFDLQPDVARALIDAGVPFTLSTVAPGSAHLQAIIGYDPLQGLYLIRDPYYPSVQEALIEEFGKQYESTGPRCLVLLPKEEEARLAGIQFPSADLYDQNFELQNALKQHDRGAAQGIVAGLKKAYPGHRLTLHAERSVARYDGNKLQELALIEQLLALYPQDLNLQSEKAYLLGVLGRQEERIGFLKAQVEQAVPHPYLVEALANSLRQDNRQAGYCAQLLRYLLYRQPTNAFALWMLAGSLWDLQEYERAFEYYRLCTCLEDKHEGYISSYFKAARFLKRQDQALEKLERRIKHLGEKSFYPYESLYFAHRALSQDSQAMAVLEAARRHHDKEGELTRRLTEIYLYNGMLERARETLAKGREQVSEATWYELNARIANHRGEWRQEKEHFEKLLALAPLHYPTVQALASLLAEHESEAAARALIDSRLDINPTDRDFLNLRLDWMYSEPDAEKEKFARHIVSLHEQDPAAHCRLAQILVERSESLQVEQDTATAEALGKRLFAEAMAQVTLAYDINPQDSDTLLTLGDLYRRQEDYDNARKYYQEAVVLSADTENLFPRLLLCGQSMQEKRDLLAFIHEQLMAQTSYGNGILEYMDVARDLIPDEDLLKFLEQAVSIRPDLWQSWAAIAMHLGTMDRVDDALSNIDNGIRRFPFIPRLLLERARLFYVSQQFSFAERDLKNALAISSQWIQGITFLADIYEAQGRLKDARALIESALNHSPRASSLHGYLADLLEQNGDPESALHSLEKALRLSPGYEWAWARYHDISGQLGHHDKTFYLAQSLREHYPNNAYLLKVLAEQATDVEQKLGFIDQALCMRPRHEDYNLVKCRILFADNRLSELREFIHDAKWAGFPLPSLLTYGAWADARYQRFETAIEKIRHVTETYPHYFDGWRFLARWLQQTGQYEEAAQHIKTCVRLSPHNPRALILAAETCIEAANNKVAVDETSINHWLKKAVVLDPKDQYNNLTWLDHLIATENLQGLAEARTIIRCDESNFYYQVRFLQADILEANHDAALQKFHQLLVSSETNTWLFDTSYSTLMRAVPRQRCLDIMEPLLKHPDVNPLLGRLWLRYAFDTDRTGKSVVPSLERLADTPLWPEALEEVFSPSRYGSVTKKVIRRYRKELQQQGRLWSLVVFYYSRQQQWKNVRSWCQSHWKRNTNDAWAVYLYSYGLRLSGDWQQAAAVNHYALTLPEDDYIDRILLWHLVDGALINRQKIELDTIGRIRVPELSALETYAFDLLQAMWAAQHQGIQGAYQDIFAILDNAKRQHHDVLHAPVTQGLKKQVRRFLTLYIQGNIWQQLLWRIRLFNRM